MLEFKLWKNEIIQIENNYTDSSILVNTFYIVLETMVLVASSQQNNTRGQSCPWPQHLTLCIFCHVWQPSVSVSTWYVWILPVQCCSKPTFDFDKVSNAGL